MAGAQAGDADAFERLAAALPTHRWFGLPAELVDEDEDEKSAETR